MIDNFAILVSHVLLALAFWRLLQRDDLDKETPAQPDQPKAAALRPSMQQSRAGQKSGGQKSAGRNISGSSPDA